MARPRKQTYTMSQYLENVIEGYITNDADTQRTPAWKPIIDGLAVTILTENYIPSIILAEEDSGQSHIIDGGSRTASFKMLRYGNYKIKSSVDDPIITYKSMIKDEDGKTIWKNETFDVRNKRFDQFPKELQKKFDEYQVDTVIHENCTKGDIAKYIKRYNEHKSMNANQKMFTYLPKFAEKIRDITSRGFFVNNCDINETKKYGGILERIIAETIMIINHLDKWNKNWKSIATFVNDNATEEQFNSLNNYIERLENIVTDETKTLFNAKDCFIWFALFDKFNQTGLDDIEFAKFLDSFIDNLKNKVVDGKLFYNVDETGSTKDKTNIVSKLHILETLMNEYLNIEKNLFISTEEFISSVTNIPKHEVLEDIDLYEQTLEDLQNKTIKYGSKLLESANKDSMLALVAYSFKNEVNLEEWLVQYAEKTDRYIVNQKLNYEKMINDYRKFSNKVA